MAGELTLSVALRFAKGNRLIDTSSMALNALAIDVAGTDFIRFSQVVSLTPAALEIGSITTPGYVVMKNIETYNASNYVTVRNGVSGADVPKLFGGDLAVFRASAATMFVDATGAIQEIDCIVIEA